MFALFYRPAAPRKAESRARAAIARGRQLELLEGRRLLSAYSVIDLGTLGGATSEAYDINSSNQVVGHSRTTAGTVRAFRFADANGNGVADAGEMVDLGSAGGAAYSYAYGMNAAGEAAGTSDPNADPANGDERAVRYSGGTAADLGRADGSNAYGINSSGAIVGGGTFGNDYLAFLRSPTGQVTTFALSSPFNDYSEARAVNDSGVVVGYSGGNSGDRAFVRSASGTLTPIAFSGATQPYSYAWDVNDAGQVVGEGFNGAGEYRAFRYAGGVVTDLTTLPGFGSSEAYGINTAGQVVGRAESATAGGASHAFLYTDAAGMQDLNALIPAGAGWVLTEARAINDNGYVTGFGVSPSGQVHAFLLAPARPPMVASLSDTPDPATRSTVTLTASASDPDNDLASVSFYRESNAAPGLQTGAGGDTLVGTDTSSADAWQVTFPKEGLSPGTYTYYAQATDANGATSAAGASATTTNTIPLGGDANLDGRVDGSDFALLAGNFGRTGQDWSKGDFNDDASVNGSDFAILAANFGRTLPAPATPAAAQASTEASPSFQSKASPAPAAKPRRQPTHLRGVPRVLVKKLDANDAIRAAARPPRCPAGLTPARSTALQPRVTFSPRTPASQMRCWVHQGIPCWPEAGAPPLKPQTVRVHRPVRSLPPGRPLTGPAVGHGRPF